MNLKQVFVVENVLEMVFLMVGNCFLGRKDNIYLRENKNLITILQKEVNQNKWWRWIKGKGIIIIYDPSNESVCRLINLQVNMMKRRSWKLDLEDVCQYPHKKDPTMPHKHPRKIVPRPVEQCYMY